MAKALVALDDRISPPEDYRTFAKEHRPWDFGKPLPDSTMGLVRNHGIPVSMEIFDTVYHDVPFTASSLTGELSTINHLSKQTQACIIGATLRWLSIQDPPQCRRAGRRWLL